MIDQHQYHRQHFQKSFPSACDILLYQNLEPLSYENHSRKIFYHNFTRIENIIKIFLLD